jgi:hypothetical protein
MDLFKELDQHLVAAGAGHRCVELDVSLCHALEVARSRGFGTLAVDVLELDNTDGQRRDGREPTRQRLECAANCVDLENPLWRDRVHSQHAAGISTDHG